MALPTTVVARTGFQGHNPPHLIGGAVYVVSLGTGANPLYRMFKATDPTSSFAEVDAGGGGSPITNDSLNIGISSVNDGQIIHVVSWGPNASATNVPKYTQFDTSTDTWGTVETISPSWVSETTNHWASIAVRSDGDVIIAHAGVTDRVMGGDKQRVDYARREGGTWTSGNALDAGGDIHYGNPICVLGVNNDEVHIVWQYTPNDTDPPTAWTNTQGITLDSSNALSTVRSYSVDTVTAMRGYQHLVAWNDGTNDVVGWHSYNSGIDYNQFNVVAEDASGDLVAAITTADDIFVLDTNASPDWVTVFNQYYSQYPITTAFDSATGDLWSIFSGGIEPASTDRDVYYSKSTDDGATWAVPTEHLDAVTANFVAANIYTRGSATVLAYVYDDGGTLKYNEYEIDAGGDNNISQLPSREFDFTNHAPSIVTTEKNRSNLPSDTLTLTAYAPNATTSEAFNVEMASQALTLTGYAPNAIASDNNQSALPSDTLTLGGFDPSAVTTEKNVALLAAATMALTAFAPQAVATENNFSQLPSQTITIADNDPTIEVTEHQISELGTQNLVLTTYDPTITVADSDRSLLPSDTITLTTYPPQAVTTEKHISELPSQALTLTKYAPTAETFDPNTSQLPSDTLTLTGYDPQAVTTEGADSDTSQLPSQALGLVGHDPSAITTEKHISELPSQALSLVGFAPGTETFDPNISQLSSDALTLTGYDPQAVTTEKNVSELPSQALTLTKYAPTVETFDPNTSQLPSDTLTLTGYDPQAVTTEGADSDTSQLPSQALTLTGYDPQAVTTEKNISELPSQALALTGFAPGTETFDPNTSQLPSDTLTLTGYDPSAVTTEGADSDVSQLPSQALVLNEFDPQAVTTEKHISELPSQALTLTKYAPTAETFDPNTSQLPSQALTLTGYGPSAVTTEQNTSELPSQALTLTKFAPQFVTTEANISELPSAALTLTGYVPQAVTTVTSDNNTSELPVASLAINLILPGGTAGVLPSILDPSYDSVSSPGDLVAECMGFDISTDGTKLFASTEDHFVHSWDLSPAFDITSASNHTVSAAISSGTNYPRDIQWSSDGLTLYALLYAVGTINKQAVSTPYNLADLGSVWDQSNDLGANNRAFHLSTDGTRLAVNLSENFQIGYSMSPAYDLSTLSQIGGSPSFFGPKGDIVVADDGLRAWMLPRDTSVVEQYTLSTAWDFSTASADGDTLTLNSSENNSLSLVFRGDRGELYVGFYGDSSVNDCIIEKYTYSDTSYAPTIVVSENNLSFIFISRGLTLTGYAPQAVTTEKNISELPGQSLTLTAHAPLVINREQRQRLFIIT